MDVTLPSGNTIAFRDKMSRSDILAVQRGTKFVTGPDGSRVMDAAFIGDIISRIVTRMTVSWSFGPPLPGDCHSAALAERRLDEVFADGADWKATEQAAAPWLDYVLTMPGSASALIHAATGRRVRADSEEDAAALLATGEFTPAPGAGPKSALTGTTSAALPPGQDQTTDPTQ